MSDRPPAERVRRLLLSGDNTLKNRSGPASIARAGERFREAREIAVAADLGDLLAIIDARLADLPDPGNG